ncbi:centlein-like [Sinocyclocheilus grahami]|uniref:centlein-like n=1 Tax=Sinocyclocheilus grahami TaxID=75366 RepID=UPI0007AC555B|nr:PREDICTED: centlein-like [Sinocyclocheilus grahami]
MLQQVFSSHKLISVDWKDSEGVLFLKEELRSLSEELAQCQTQENEDLRRAHAKHHDRLRVIQTNYRTMSELLKEAEDTRDLLNCETQVQQDSEDSWKELVFYRRRIRSYSLTSKCLWFCQVM